MGQRIQPVGAPAVIGGEIADEYGAVEVRELAAIVTGSLPGDGLDRMTVSRIEEFLTPVALTAHL